MSNNTNNTNTTKYTLLVPFDDKDIVKKLGAKWDSLNKNWFFQSNLENPLPEELHKYKSYPVHNE